MMNQVVLLAGFVAVATVAGPHRRHAAPEHAAKNRADNAHPRRGPTAGQGRAAAVHGLIRAKAAKAKAAPQPAVEDVEPVEAVEAVEAVENRGAGEPAQAAGGGATDGGEPTKTKMSTQVLLGHMHAAVVHLPIAWLLLWSAFEALGLLWAHPWLIMAGLPMGLVTCVSFAPAVYTGLMRLDELALASPSYDVTAAHLHRNLLFVGWALVVVACGMRLTSARPGRSFVARACYIGLVWLALAVTGWSAHLGGCMVYGDDFFGL